MHQCVYARYLSEVIDSLNVRLTDLATVSVDHQQSGFEEGRRIAYFEIVSILENRALSMQLHLPDLGLSLSSAHVINAPRNEPNTASLGGAGSQGAARKRDK